MVDSETFEMERELHYLKKERTAWLMKIRERSMLQKMLPYIIWFLLFSAAKFMENWASFYLNGPINYTYFLIFLWIIIFLDLSRLAWKDYILKKVREYSDQIKKLEHEMAVRSIPD